MDSQAVASSWESNSWEWPEVRGWARQAQVATMWSWRVAGGQWQHVNGIDAAEQIRDDPLTP